MKTQRGNNFFLRSGLAALIVLVLVLLPINHVLSQSEYPESKTAVLIPNPVSPTGMIGDYTPTFKWTKVIGATQYRFQVFKGTNTAALYTKTITTPKCGTTFCANTPTNKLMSASYKWKVQAYINGSWKPYSTLKSFSIVIPEPVAPVGTIYDNTPTFKWKKIINATQYRYWVFEGSRILYLNTIATPKCDTTYCSNTPTKVLPYSGYWWTMQAYVNGKWSTYSNDIYFSLSTPTGFSSQFNGSMQGWVKLGKFGWTVYEGQYLSVGGIPFLEAANAYYTLAQYSNFEYSVRAAYSAAEYGEYSLIVRAGTQVNSGNNDWYPGYVFTITNSGYYAVGKNDSNGKYVTLVPYKYFEGIGKNDWNILRVVASGSTLKFYINGTLVSTTIDSSRLKGYVGLQVWGENSNSKLLVDWAVLGLLSN